MKKSLYTILLITSSLSVATAQTEKGRWTVGTDVGNLSYQDQNYYRSFQGNLTPSAAYFVANRLLIGTGIPLGLSTSSSSSSAFRSEYHNEEIGLSPFVRYYFGPSAFKPYVGVSYSYLHISRQYVTPSGDGSGTGYSTALAPTVGIAYFINRSIALNAGLNYNIRTSKTPYPDFSNSPSPPVLRVTDIKSDDKSLSLSIGFQLFFGK